MANAIMTVYGGPPVAATVLGRGASRIPTAGKIRAGIKVLSRAAADEPRARELYDQGVAAGQSFEQIEKAIADVLPKIRTPLVPRNVAWFTVRGRDFANPVLAEQLLDAHGEDRGEGRRLYRFPVVFPSDHWQTVMPHELAAWGAHEKRYWSAYSPDGRVRHCLCHAPVPLVDNGKRAIRIFGGRKTMLREDNGGVCEPEACGEYQLKQCNLSGRFLFFVPGIRSVSAFELHTNSFYAMNAAIQTFETIGFLRGGRISGFLDRQRTPFYLSKRLMEVSHIDEQGKAVRVPQWIIELQAPVDVAALLREHEDDEAAIVQADTADAASHVLERIEPAAQDVEDRAAAGDTEPPTPGQGGEPSADKVLARAIASGVAAERYEAYADRRWGSGWKLNRHGRRRAWDELERYRNDPQGYADKVDTEMRTVS